MKKETAMKLVKKALTGLGSILVAALLIAALAPKATHGLVAALVRDEDNPARHPFVTQCHPLATTNNYTSCDTPAIPSGEEVVIERVSVFSLADPTNHVLEVQISTTTAGSPSGAYLNAISDSGKGQPLFASFQGGESLRLYADPGTVIGCTADTNGSSPSQDFSLQCDFSGYYVTLP